MCISILAEEKEESIIHCRFPVLLTSRPSRFVLPLSGWVGYGEARGSIAAFLFVLNPDGKSFTKLRKVGGAGMAVIDNPESGVCFGADSLVIPLSNDNPRLARSKLGSYYERFADGGNSLFGKDAAVQLSDFKVYHGVYEEGEYVPFTDAEPFALY